MSLLKEIKEALRFITIIIGFMLFIAAPAAIGIYIDKNREPVYKDYVVVDKLMNYTYSKSGQHQVLSFIVKDVLSGELESKDVSKVTHYKYNVGDSVRFEDDSKRSFFLGTLGLILSGLLAIVLVIIGTARTEKAINNY